MAFKKTLGGAMFYHHRCISVNGIDAYG